MSPYLFAPVFILLCLWKDMCLSVSVSLSVNLFVCVCSVSLSMPVSMCG
jgi:hypothetical protein